MKDNLRLFRQKEQGGPTPGRGNQNNQSQPIRVNADDLENLKCGKCGGEVWEQALNMKIVPMTISPTGKQEISPAPTILCKNCGSTVEETIEGLDK